jgi:hypothetical protein
MDAAKLKEEQFKALVEREGHLLDATTAFERFLVRVPFLLNGGGLVVYLAVVDASQRNPGLGAFSFDGWWVIAASVLWSAGLMAAAMSARRAWRGQYQYLKATRRARDKIEADYEGDIAAKHEAKKNRDASRSDAETATKDSRSLWTIGVVSFVAGGWAAIYSAVLP